MGCPRVLPLWLAAYCVAPLAAGLDKQQTHAEMLRLAEQIQALKGSGSAAWPALQERYRELSQALGGDDPGRALRRARALSRRASKAPATKPRMLSSPPAPPDCVVARRVFANNTPTSIPDNGVVTSTIQVTGLGGELFDLDLQANIRHTFPGDLDITLTSPAGTSVTLTTDNGDSTINAFHGTLWDDQADDPVSDHVFAGTAARLSPEEPLAGFRGESVQGTWTLTISDDSDGDTGTLDAWSLTIATTGSRVRRSVGTSNITPVPIPVTGTVTSAVVVPPMPTLPSTAEGVSVFANITHTFPNDLEIELISPAGTVVTLSTDNGGGNDDVFAGTLWHDQADPGNPVPYPGNPDIASDHSYSSGVAATQLTPEEPFSLLQGEDLVGTWTLSVTDDAPGDSGTLVRWGVAALQTIECAGKGDYALDGHDSLVLRNVNSNQHVIWFMNGVTRQSGAFVTPAPGPTQQVVGSDQFLGYGYADLVFHDAVSGQVEFWEMTSATRVTPPVPLTGAAPLPTNWKLSATGDFNHDGFADLLWRNSTSGNVVIWTLGQFGAPPTEKTGVLVPDPPQAVNSNWEIAAALDFDGDSNRDLLWYNTTSGSIVVWYMDANMHRISSAFTSPSSAGNANWRVVAAGDYGPGDLYGDHHPDIVWRNETSGKFVVWHMDGGFPTLTRLGGGVFTNPDSPANPLGWRIVAPR